MNLSMHLICVNESVEGFNDTVTGSVQVCKWSYASGCNAL